MIRIMTDSTSDLSPELIKRYNISVIPLHVLLGAEEYLDGVNISPEEIYSWADANKETPKTSAPAIADVIAAFRRFPNDEIICFAISGTMSASANVMRLAAEELNRTETIHVINSKNLSTGIGLLVIEAAIMAKNGMNVQWIVNEIEALIPRVRASFIVDTLKYLHRGGRCSGVAALAGGALKLHPMIKVEDGIMLPDKKYRGTLGKSLKNYTLDKHDELLAAKAERVFITHSGCDDATVREVYDYLAGLEHFQEIHITRAGGVVSSHCGPGTLGVLYIL